MTGETPMPVRWPSHRLRLALDLQYRSICREIALRTRGGGLRNARVLDVGTGHGPYRRYFAGCREYVTVDPATAADYRRVRDLPAGRRFDLALVIEVLEHVEDPAALLAETARHLVPGGRLWVTVPFSARIHRAPEDYWRWTDSGLRRLAARAGLGCGSVTARGTDGVSLAAKTFYFAARRLLHPATALPAAAGLAALLPLGLPLAHLSLTLSLGHGDDPLGFFVEMQRPGRMKRRDAQKS